MIFIYIFTLFLHCEYSNPINLEGLNSKDNEFGLRYNYYEDMFYFHSDRSGKSKFYIFNNIGNNNVEYLNNSINNLNENVSYITFLNKEKAIFSKFNEYKRQSYLNLYLSNYYKQAWNKGLEISELNNNNFISQPSISPDQKFMIFVSDMDSENSDTDLYISYINELGEWDSPILLSEINSEGNEITPFLLSPDSLLFASDGQGGQGGFDIFISKKILGKWQRPHPIKSVNTIYNETDPFIKDDTLIFSSDRIGGKGKYDFYLSINNNSNGKSIDLSELDVSFSTYVSNINVKTQSKYKEQSIYPYIHYDADETDFNNSFYERNTNTLEQIAKFIKLGNSIEIACWTKSEIEEESQQNSKYINDKRILFIQQYLKNNFNIDNAKININYYYSKVAKNYIYFYSKDKFLEYSKESDLKISIEPSSLIFKLDVEPKNVIGNFNIEIKINNKPSKQIMVGKELPLNSKIDLQKFDTELSKSDSLIVILNMFSSENNIISKEYLYTINNSYEKIKEEEKNALRFFLISTEDIEDEKIIENLLRKIENKFNQEKLIIESSFDINNLILKLKEKSKFNFIYRKNDNLGKEIIIK